jgi:outer membrane protein insertion porin family
MVLRRRPIRVCARAAVILLAMALSVAATFCAGADPAIIVHGNRRIDADAIRAHFQAARGGTLDAAALDAALKELYATGGFEDVKIVRSGAQVIVTVIEAPLIGRLQFEGNKQLKDADLAKATMLKAGQPLTKAAVQADVATIAEIYRLRGRYAARITPKTIAHGDGRIDLVFEIDEGAKTVVKQIVFSGNHAFTASRLKAVIQTTESNWLSFLKSSDTYDADRVQADGELIRRFYLKNGYADARMISATGSYDPVQKGFVVTFALDEGDRYRFGTVDIVSHVPTLEAAAFRSALPIAAGGVYDGEAAAKAIDQIAIAVGKRGYRFVSVLPRVNRNLTAKTVDLVFVLDAGPRKYVERIAIHGNAITHDTVIRREFDFAEGDAYDRALIDRAERRLKALGLFKSVKIASAEGSMPDRVVLDVAVEEQRTGAFSIAGGYSTADGLLAEVSVSEQNLFGLGKYAKVSATIGQYVRGGSLSVAEPYFLDQRMTLGVDLFYRETLTNPNQSYGSTGYGTALKVGVPLTDGLSMEGHYSLTNQSVSLSPTAMDCLPTSPSAICPAGTSASAAAKQAVLDGPLWTSAVGTTLAYSTLDNPRDPHDGLRAEVKQDVAGLGGGVDFLRSTGDVRYYQSFGDGVVGMTRASAGTIAPYGGQTLPLTSSFFGGPQLVRGFAPNGFGPRDLTPGTTMDNVGGSAYWTTSAQLAAPIPGLPPEVALKGAFFADAGSLWGYRGPRTFPALSQSLNVADSRQVRASVGTSLIWDSPVGALHVDYALPVAKTSYDITQRLSFGAGAF